MSIINISNKHVSAETLTTGWVIPSEGDNYQPAEIST
jgi:hypothetical protein